MGARAAVRSDLWDGGERMSDERHLFDDHARHVWLWCPECLRLDLNGALAEVRALLFAGLDR